MFNINIPDGKPTLPPPLSRTVVGGSTWVIRARDRKPVRIVDLAIQQASNKAHELLTPVGVRSVNIQIGAFVPSIPTIRAHDGTNKPHTFVTNIPGIHVGPGAYLASGVVFALLMNGNSIKGLEKYYEYKNGEPGDRLIELELAGNGRSGEMYLYTMTPGPIYLGAGQTPVFLPFNIDDDEPSHGYSMNAPTEGL